MDTTAKGYPDCAEQLAEDGEKAPSLAPGEGLPTPPKPPAQIPQPLRYGDIPNAVRTSYDAILDDPLTHYLDAVDTAPGREWRQKLAHGLSLTDHVSNQTVWTVNGGDAIVTASIPGNKGGRFLPLCAPILKKFDTAELVKRKQEYITKLKALLKTAFGDSIEDMIELQGLATAPQEQGKGYGTILTLLVNATADVQRRGVWLVTSNTQGFYQRVGYSVVQEDVLGVDNPEWSGEPVPIRVMYRSPRKFPFETGAEKPSMV